MVSARQRIVCGGGNKVGESHVRPHARTHTGTRVIVLAQDLEIRIINAADPADAVSLFKRRRREWTGSAAPLEYPRAKTRGLTSTGANRGAGQAHGPDRPAGRVRTSQVDQVDPERR